MRKVVILNIIITLLNLIDAGATHYSLLHFNGQELNPIINFLIEYYGFVSMYAFKFLICLGVSISLILIAKNNIKMAVRTCWIVLAMFIFITMTHFLNFFHFFLLTK
jgi:hypothetical protein